MNNIRRIGKINIFYRLTSNLNLDIMSTVAFSMECDSQHNPKSEFAKHAEQFTANFSAHNWRFQVTGNFY